MDMDSKSPRLCAEDLRNLTYSELRKEATKYGIKRRMKSGKLIAAILSNASNADDDDYAFSTPAAKEINSCRKNKENIFDEVQMTPLTTPRRGTYSIETPFSVKTEDLSSASLAVNASDLDLSNVTMSRGSERKLRPRKVSFMSPALTPRTPRNQSLRNRPKTPIASRTPLNESISSGGRKRKSFGDSFLDSTPQAKIAKGEMQSDMNSSAISKSLNSLSTQSKVDADTSRASQNFRPSVESSIIKKSANSPQSSITQETKEDAETSKSEFSTKSEKSSETKEIAKEKTSRKKGITFNDKKTIIKKEPTSVKRGATPSDKKTIIKKEPTSVKRGATPNFRRIHEKAFEKMESIDDYEKRKLLNSAKKINQRPNFKSKVTKVKSKIPGFGGIPFIPSVSASSSTRLNTKVNKLGLADVLDKCKAGKENILLSGKSNIGLSVKNITKKDTPQPKSKFNISKNISKKETPQSSVKSKSRFDLKASLSRKLTYKPYKGPLKPLTESNSLSATSFINIKEPVINKVVKENRLQTRSMIRGVRVNKRFELQMKNRTVV